MDSVTVNENSSQEILDFHFTQFKNVWDHWCKNKELPPVAIFVGPAGSGKDLLIHFISKMLQCRRSPFYKEASASLSFFGEKEDATLTSNDPIYRPCGQCASCRKADSESWVDFVEIEAEKNTEGKPSRIKLEALEVIRKKLGFRAHESTFQIFHIKDAEQLTPQASNALLKILEEPPEGWLFFLSAADSNLLLPTLRSRAQLFRLKSIPDEVLEKVLASEGIPAHQSNVAIKICSGDIARAKDILTSENWELRNQMFKFIFSPKRHLMELVEETHKRPKALEILMDQLETVTHDLLMDDQRKWINVDFRDPLLKYRDSFRSDSGQDGKKIWFACNQEIQKTRARLNLPLNRKILAQNLLSGWCR